MTPIALSLLLPTSHRDPVPSPTERDSPFRDRRISRDPIDNVEDIQSLALKTLAYVGLYMLTALAGATGIGLAYWAAFRSQLKAHEIGAQFFGSLGLIALAMTPIIGWSIIYLIRESLNIDKKEKRKFLDALSQDVLLSLQTLIDHEDSPIPSIDDLSLDPDLKSSIGETFHQLIDVIITQKSPSCTFLGTDSEKYRALQFARRAIHKIVSSRAYKKMITAGTNVAFTKFMQVLSHKMRDTPLASDHFASFGRAMITVDDKDNFSFSEIADVLQSAVRAHRQINSDTPLNTLFTKIAYPDRGLGSFLGNFEKTGSDYNSYELGNINSTGYEFDFVSEGKTKKISFHYGPGPQSDGLFKAEAQLFERVKLPGPLYIQVNLQKETGSEGKRSELLATMHDETENFRLITLSMDGTAWRAKGPFQQYLGGDHTIGKYCQSYLKHITDKGHHRCPSNSEGSTNHGFYIPSDLLDDDELENAIKAVSEGLGAEVNISGDDIQRYEILRGIQLCIQTALTLRLLFLSTKDMDHSCAYPEYNEILDRELKDIIQKAYFGQACKQDIDRGVAANILTRLFAMRLGGQKITKKVVEETVGAVIGRAQIVDHRAILLDRIIPALAALDLVSNNERPFIDSLKKYVFNGEEATVEVIS